ncbi:MAG: hypothetical protein HYU77_16250 [Betaproteobacteria bacterium]|nr:hypothetical protein [Betaproteobacteria bacterium]
MKQTLYDLLDLGHDADQAAIDAAFDAQRQRLARGVTLAEPDAMNRLRMIRDGYRILSSPERRRQYDETVSRAAAADLSRTAYRVEEPWRRRGVSGAAVSVFLVSMTAMAYGGLAILERSNELRIAYVETVAKKKAERERAEKARVDEIRLRASRIAGVN